MWSWLYQAEYLPLHGHPRWQKLTQRVGRSAPVTIGR
jgi:hypothetical protein